jgi:hypothetical protein
MFIGSSPSAGGLLGRQSTSFPDAASPRIDAAPERSLRLPRVMQDSFCGCHAKPNDSEDRSFGDQLRTSETASGASTGDPVLSLQSRSPDTRELSSHDHAWRRATD